MLTLLIIVFLFLVSWLSAEESPPSPLVAMLISGVKGLLLKYWILFCCSMFFVISFSGKVSIDRVKNYVKNFQDVFIKNVPSLPCNLWDKFLEEIPQQKVRVRFEVRRLQCVEITFTVVEMHYKLYVIYSTQCLGKMGRTCCCDHNAAICIINVKEFIRQIIDHKRKEKNIFEHT